MKEFSAHRDIIVNFNDIETNNGFRTAILIIEQLGSFPCQPFCRDQERLSGSTSGTLGTVKKKLEGICEWSIISKWGEESPKQWDILTLNGEENYRSCLKADGFKHVLKFHYKKMPEILIITRACEIDN